MTWTPFSYVDFSLVGSKKHLPPTKISPVLATICSCIEYITWTITCKADTLCKPPQGVLWADNKTLMSNWLGKYNEEVKNLLSNDTWNKNVNEGQIYQPVTVSAIPTLVLPQRVSILPAPAAPSLMC
ncbi:hypothetical protein EDD22DRAFT_850447 [Suillus occidentalis]|nr:hypothetical protein EDD22DRAFT_850447 [Suillus occidentalis]